MSDQNAIFQNGHRDRLRQKFLDGKLTDYERLELLLGYVIPRRDVRPLARGLLERFETVFNVITTPLNDLIAFPGIGRNTAIFLHLVHALMIDAARGRVDMRPIHHDIKSLHAYCVMNMSGKSVEELHVLYLDTDNRVLQDETHATGTVDCAAVYPREIIKRALSLNATRVILYHNHPIGDRSFSSADLDLTLDVGHKLRSVDIELYDHLLVTNGVVHSAREMGLMYELENH